MDPSHGDAWVNLGRLLHEAGDPRAAAQHYRKAIELNPDNVVALFNLGVALEDLRMPEEAILAYRTALAADSGCADAHYNLSQLYEARGEGAAALRHFRTYRKLVHAGSCTSGPAGTTTRAGPGDSMPNSRRRGGRQPTTRNG